MLYSIQGNKYFCRERLLKKRLDSAEINTQRKDCTLKVRLKGIRQREDGVLIPRRQRKKKGRNKLRRPLAKRRVCHERDCCSNNKADFAVLA